LDYSRSLKQFITQLRSDFAMLKWIFLIAWLMPFWGQQVSFGQTGCDSPVDRNDRPFGTYSDSDRSTTCPAGGGGSFGGIQSHRLKLDQRQDEGLRQTTEVSPLSDSVLDLKWQRQTLLPVEPSYFPLGKDDIRTLLYVPDLFPGMVSQ
jgi:hypothetical protein